MHEPSLIDRQAVAPLHRIYAARHVVDFRPPGQRELGILHDGQRLEQREVLEHHADAQAACMGRVAQHNRPVDVRDGDRVRTVSAGLSVFRIGPDGKLTFARAYDVDVGDKSMWWMGMVPL